jgi:hypothetical protein
MPQTIRKYWNGPFLGRVPLNFNWDAIDGDSVVLITASLFVGQPNPPPGTDLQRVDSDFNSVQVANISPHGPPFDPNRGVTFVIVTGMSGISGVAIDITVLDDQPVDVLT